MQLKEKFRRNVFLLFGLFFYLWSSFDWSLLIHSQDSPFSSHSFYRFHCPAVNVIQLDWIKIFPVGQAWIIGERVLYAIKIFDSDELAFYVAVVKRVFKFQLNRKKEFQLDHWVLKECSMISLQTLNYSFVFFMRQYSIFHFAAV